MSIAAPSVPVLTIPSDDHAFREAVGAAIARAIGMPRQPGEPIEAPETVVRAAFARIRADYPDAALRVQDPIATIDGRAGVYVFRDGR